MHDKDNKVNAFANASTSNLNLESNSGSLNAPGIRPSVTERVTRGHFNQIGNFPITFSYSF